MTFKKGDVVEVMSTMDNDFPQGSRLTVTHNSGLFLRVAEQSLLRPNSGMSLIKPSHVRHVAESLSDQFFVTHIGPDGTETPWGSPYESEAAAHAAFKEPARNGAIYRVDTHKRIRGTSFRVVVRAVLEEA